MKFQYAQLRSLAFRHVSECVIQPARAPESSRYVVIAWRATWQVVHASGANWTTFLEAENFSPVVVGPPHSSTSSNRRPATWRLVFMCQRPILPLRRIVYWPQLPPLARPAKNFAADRRYLTGDSQKKLHGRFPSAHLEHVGAYRRHRSILSRFVAISV